MSVKENVERLNAGANIAEIARIQNDSANSYAGKGSSFEATVTTKRVTPGLGDSDGISRS